MLPFPQDLVGGSREVCRGIAMCFCWSCIAGVAWLACLLAFGVKEAPNLYPCIMFLLYHSYPAVLASFFSSLLGSFMLLKPTTRNSLNSYFEMAESANSSADVPVSSAFPASTSPSGSQANVPHDSSSPPALPVETLMASIVGALRPLFASAQANQLQSLVSSLPSTSLTDSSNLPLAVSSSLVASSSAPHLPSAVQTPSTGRPIVVPSFVNTGTFTAPAGSSRILPSSLSMLSPSIASAPLPACPTSFSSSTVPTLQQPFIVGPGFLPVPYKLVSQITSGKFINLMFTFGCCCCCCCRTVLRLPWTEAC